MNKAQNSAGHKFGAPASPPVQVAFPSAGPLPLGAHYDAMTAARDTFIKAFNAWVIYAQPPAAAADAEIVGTASALVQWSVMLREEDHDDGR